MESSLNKKTTKKIILGSFYIIYKLMALLVTLIVLLILAGVSLSAVFSEKGIFSRAEKAGDKYNEAKAREVLETVLLADGQYEKNTNPKYNQDDFLDDLIEKEIPGSRIIEGTDVVVIEEKYAYELDRSVPKIGTSGNNGYLGNPKDLVFPTVNGSFQLENYNQNASITVTALEEKNGINKIEIWFGGEKIKEYTYDNVKTQVTTNPAVPVYRNGTYIVKAYGNLSASTTVTVVGIVPAVTFLPDGNAEWKRQHSTTVTVDETYTKVVSMKYLWTQSQVAPEETEFTDTQTCINNGTVSGGNDTMTGTYYLWILLTTNAGKTRCSSAGFNFDNEGATISSFTVEKYSETGITFNVTAQDTGSGITKIEFYVDNIIQSDFTQTCTPTTESFTKTVNITGLNTGEHNCKVVVYDLVDNQNYKTKTGTTMLYAWKKVKLLATRAAKDDFVLGTDTSSINAGWVAMDRATYSEPPRWGGWDIGWVFDENTYLGDYIRCYELEGRYESVYSPSSSTQDSTYRSYTRTVVYDFFHPDTSYGICTRRYDEYVRCKAQWSNKVDDSVPAETVLSTNEKQYKTGVATEDGFRYDKLPPM